MPERPNDYTARRRAAAERMRASLQEPWVPAPSITSIVPYLAGIFLLTFGLVVVLVTL